MSNRLRHCDNLKTPLPRIFSKFFLSAGPFMRPRVELFFIVSPELRILSLAWPLLETLTKEFELRKAFQLERTPRNNQRGITFPWLRTLLKDFNDYYLRLAWRPQPETEFLCCPRETRCFPTRYLLRLALFSRVAPLFLRIGQRSTGSVPGRKKSPTWAFIIETE